MDTRTDGNGGEGEGGDTGPRGLTRPSRRTYKNHTARVLGPVGPHCLAGGWGKGEEMKKKEEGQYNENEKPLVNVRPN